MNGRVRGKNFSLTSIVLTMLFALFAIWFNHSSRTVAEERVTEHAQIISTSIWTLDINTQKEYLEQACIFYDYQQLTVIDSAGDILLHLEYPASGFLDKLLIDSGLIPLVQLTEDVYYNKQKLGSISVIKQHKTIYIYFYVFLFFCLTLTIFYLYLKIFEQNKTLERANKELQHARLKADDANQAKSTFLANMSHELRTPLNAVLGFSDLMARDPETNQEQNEILSIIKRSGQHLLGLINDILDMSKIEAGHTVLEPKPGDLHHLLYDIEDMFKQRAEEKGLEFNLKLHSDLPQHVTLDETKLRQVLINLLGNAVKFTEVGSVNLWTDVEHLGGSKHRLRFGIEDTGSGIPDDEIKTIFEPFAQAAHSPAKQQGTGLGLAISRQFVQLMGGDLTVESSLGKGAIFRFDISAEATNDKEIEVIVNQTQRKIISLAEGNADWRILIVEDDATNRMLLCRLLERVGFMVHEAVNGEEGVKQFKEWQPHFIWMDICMPVMGGSEATAKIRRMPGGDKVKIVAVTASVFTSQHQEIIESGCDDVVSKPFHSAEIFETMAEQLGVQYVYEQEVNADI